jgi:hypothetical protein
MIASLNLASAAKTLKAGPSEFLKDAGQVGDHLLDGGAAEFEQAIQQLGSTPFWLGLIMVVIGLVYLLAGWRLFRFMIVLSSIFGGAVFGIVLTGWVGRENMWWGGMILGAVVFGVLSYHLVRYYVGLYGLALGYVIGVLLLRMLVDATGRSDFLMFWWAAGLILAVPFAIFAFIYYRVVTMYLMAMSGASLVMTGGLSVLLSQYGADSQTVHALSENPFTIRLVWFCLVAGGTILQLILSWVFQARQKQQKELVKRQKEARQRDYLPQAGQQSRQAAQTSPPQTQPPTPTPPTQTPAQAPPPPPTAPPPQNDSNHSTGEPPATVNSQDIFWQ